MRAFLRLSKVFFRLLCKPEDANVIIQSDGGRRSEHDAAASYVVGILKTNNGYSAYEPWFAHGTYLRGNVTVFQAEAIALEESLLYFTEKLREFK